MGNLSLESRFPERKSDNRTFPGRKPGRLRSDFDETPSMEVGHSFRAVVKEAKNEENSRNGSDGDALCDVIVGAELESGAGSVVRRGVLSLVPSDGVRFYRAILHGDEDLP